MSRKLKRTNLFAKDVSSLLYAYGDVSQPLPETVQCLDELVSGYLVDVCSSAFRAAQNCQRNKLKLEDFRFAVRRDPIKLGRAEDLVATNKLITEAKKQFNGSDSSSLKRFKDGEGNDLEGEGEDEDYEDYDDEADEDAAGGGNTHLDDDDKHMDSEIHHKSKGNIDNSFEDDNELHQVKSEKKSKSSTRGGKQGSRGGSKTRGKRQKRGTSGT
ncbi:hypothetical protein ZYGR_0A00220 [Zygosaccharomyces rouxii]|uniref:Transcription initiation factor TFIID subunit 13 n=2 Tax=Zygosaccharomyces rouxii TaxID=4956 RepID=C5DP51_ZYGRC|nr:uncharacterized protein ZYRO0A00462g [Zygosaccharomyces rouxii]KAH9199020.1 transcription initiation factor IID, 18kD subunit-domain-containing protein [Zygosaccharomyces rouxii]GAV46431.1 hypothetical protein ZYGR_0A00220 [Zygosaccharomyces rouxii]CAR25462.1 ZYRO0A00462p [Zygosaccharomyces rouxii]